MIDLGKKIIAALNGVKGSININGASYSGENVQIKTINGNTQIIVDGVVVQDAKMPKVEINVDGNAGAITTASGNVNVTGNVLGDIDTTSGDIECGDVRGDVDTVSGKVTALNIGGDVDTVSGRIQCSGIGTK